ncbi:hypothetical protein HOY82DRAFT_542556 [Tuber indicum]|nr:hypothetical protein HOY82DRAFT_542556 [Tuber indicum]
MAWWCAACQQGQAANQLLPQAVVAPIVPEPPAVVPLQPMGLGRQGEQQRCGRCRRHKGLEDFDHDKHGRTRKCCRDCLLKAKGQRAKVPAVRQLEQAPNGEQAVAVPQIEPLQVLPILEQVQGLAQAEEHLSPPREFEVPEPAPAIDEEMIHNPLLRHRAEPVDAGIPPAPIPLASVESRDRWRISALGRMDVACTACNALHWKGEWTRLRGHGIAGAFESCCKRGDSIKVVPAESPSLEFTVRLYIYKIQYG